MPSAVAQLAKPLISVAHDRDFVQRTIAEVKPRQYDDKTFLKPLTSYTSKLTADQAKALQAYLRAHGYEFRSVPYARFAAEREKTNVVFYESGKLVVQGKGTQEFVEFVLSKVRT